MADVTFTLVEGDRASEVTARIENDTARVSAEALREATGWELKPEGLCRGEVCVPVRESSGLADERGVDLASFAEALGRPLALDLPERAAALGVAVAERAGQLETLEAPDFTLPDLAGRLHSLSEHRGKKVLLIAYASW